MNYLNIYSRFLLPTANGVKVIICFVKGMIKSKISVRIFYVKYV